MSTKNQGVFPRNKMEKAWENGCAWRRLPKEYGNRPVIYKRFNRWVKAGVIDRLFRELHVPVCSRNATLTIHKIMVYLIM